MVESTSRHSDNTLDWLLEESNPSVRYYALLNLLDKQPEDKAVRKARSAIMKAGRVADLLDCQTPEGYWGPADQFYMPKPGATAWQFFTLIDFGADPDDDRVRRTAEYMIQRAQHRESGAFSANTHDYMMKHHANQMGKWFLPVRDNQGGSSMVLSCFTGQLLSSLIRAGYLDDPRIQRSIDWIVKYQRFDDPENTAPDVWPYNTGGNPDLSGNQTGARCWGNQTCHTGAAWILRALSEIPEHQWSVGIERVIRDGVEFFLRRHIFKQGHDSDHVSISDWMNLGFPHMDFLHVLRTILKLGYRDDRLYDAIDELNRKRKDNGRWLADVAGYEKKGEESKWVTLYALSALKMARSLDFG